MLKELIQYRGLDYKCVDFLSSFQRMQDLTFKKLIIYSAFKKSSLYPFNPSAILAKLKEFSTLEQTLTIDNLGLELGFKVDFQRCLILMSLQIYKAYTSYINKKLA
jgi:hypothetical protein